MNRKTSKHSPLKFPNEIYTELSSKLCKSFASWSAIKHDMDFVIEAFRQEIELGRQRSQNRHTYVITIDEENIGASEIIEASLYRAAVITYAKNFYGSEGRLQQLNKSIFRRKQKLIPFHEELMNERLTYHAHSGISDKEEITPIIIFAKDDKIKNRLASVRFSVLSKKEDIISQYITVAQYVSSYAQNKAVECAKKVYQEEITTTVLDKLYEKAKRDDDSN